MYSLDLPSSHKPDKAYMKAKVDELLQEKKRQLEIIRLFNIQVQKLQNDHLKLKQDLKVKSN